MEKNVSSEMADFEQLLTTLSKLKEAGQWDKVIGVVGEKLGTLLDVKGPKELRELTETGILAKLVSSGPMATLWFPYKQIMLICLLKEAGDYAGMKFPPNGGNGWYLNSLHLLLDALAHEELNEYSRLTPSIGELLAALGQAPLSEKTRLSLAREYNRKGVSSEAKEQIKAALENALKPQ